MLTNKEYQQRRDAILTKLSDDIGTEFAGQIPPGTYHLNEAHKEEAKQEGGYHDGYRDGYQTAKHELKEARKEERRRLGSRNPKLEAILTPKVIADSTKAVANTISRVKRKDNQMSKIKWQIRAETSLTQIMLWVVIGKLFGGWTWALAAVFIAGNLVTLIRSSVKLGGDYFKDPNHAPTKY